MKLTTVDSLGYHFTDNKGRFCKSTYVSTHKISNTLVQIQPTVGGNVLYLMKENDVNTLNAEYKKKYQYVYLDMETRINNCATQYPSSVANKLLKVFMLNIDIAEQLLKTTKLWLNKPVQVNKLWLNMPVQEIIKPEFYKDFRYELQPTIIKVPTSTTPKQSKRPVRKVA